MVDQIPSVDVAVESDAILFRTIFDESVTDDGFSLHEDAEKAVREIEAQLYGR